MIENTEYQKSLNDFDARTLPYILSDNKNSRNRNQSEQKPSSQDIIDRFSNSRASPSKLNSAEQNRSRSPIQSLAERRKHRQQELQDLNRKVSSLFHRELDDQQEYDFYKHPDQRKVDLSRPEGAGSIKLQKQTSSTSLERDEDIGQRLRTKLEEMEERERLIFLEKMGIKKQKDDLMTLIDELNVLKSSGRLRSPNESRAVEPPNNKMREDRR